MRDLLDTGDAVDALDMPPFVVRCPTVEADTVPVCLDRWTLAEVKGGVTSMGVTVQ